MRGTRSNLTTPVDKSKIKNILYYMIARKMTTAEKMALIKDMRLKRFTYREIGEMLGISKQRVWQLDIMVKNSVQA